MTLLLTLLAPLLVLALSVGRRPLALWPVWATTPAVLLALFGHSHAPLELSWLILGTRLSLDETGRIFLLLTSLLWLLAGLYSYRTYTSRRYLGFWLLTMTGNLGVILAYDVVSFYLSFALMTFAAFGLVVYSGTSEAYRAGRVYLVMALFGEALLLAGLLMSASSEAGLNLPALAGVALPLLPSLLLLVGFGIKVGVFGLHMWLPLAHPVAPTPASAVLSGLLIKTGLLGWLRFLPLGEVVFAALGLVLLVLAVVGVFGAAVIGVSQASPKTVLAYSSVSQMGLVSLMVGLVLLEPQSWSIAVPGILIFVLHHGLVKAALFMAVGLERQLLVRLGSVVAAALLIGLPLTGGALVKTLFKEAIGGAYGWLELLLTFSATATTVLMLRYLILLSRPSSTASAPLPLLSWLLTLIAALLVPPLVTVLYGWPLGAYSDLNWQKTWTLSWPVLLGAMLFVLHVRIKKLPLIPAGDLLLVIEQLWQYLRQLPSPQIPRFLTAYRPASLYLRLEQLELQLRRWDTAGALWLLLGLVLIGLILLGGRYA